MFRDFVKWMTAVTGIVWVLLALPLYFLGEPTIVWGIIVGCLLPALCFMAGFYTLCRSFHRSLNTLMQAVFGGMLIRLLIIGAAFVMIVKLTELHLVSFLSSLLGFYILYLIIELYFVNGRLQSVGENHR